jgi:hypothetical protein
MESQFDIGGMTAVSITGLTASMLAPMTRALRPWTPTTGVPGAIAIDLVTDAPNWDEVLGDSGDGRRTGIRQAQVGTLLDDGWWSIEGPGDPLRLQASRGFGGTRLIAEVLRPAAMVQVARLGGVTIHGSAVIAEDGPWLLAGWSEAGKTETALAFLETGGTVVADKWTLVRPDRRMVGYPGPVIVRAWLLPYLPGLRSRVSLRMRAQPAAARLAGIAPAVLRRLPGPVAGEVARRLKAITDLGGSFRFSLDDLAPGGRVPEVTEPLRRLVLLRATPGPEIQVSGAAADAVLGPLLISASHERQPWRTLIERAAFGSQPVDLRSLEVMDLEREALRAMLSEVEIVVVRAPFPSDPRRIRDAILDHR